MATIAGPTQSPAPSLPPPLALASADHAAASATAHFAMLGLVVALVGLGSLILWIILRWARRRAHARAIDDQRRARATTTASAWVEAGRRAAHRDPTPTPWPSIPNPNLRDPVQRAIERADEAAANDEDDDDGDSASPLDETTPLDHPNSLHDTDADDHWELELPDNHPHQLDDDDDREHTDFGDESIGFHNDPNNPNHNTDRTTDPNDTKPDTNPDNNPDTDPDDTNPNPPNGPRSPR